MKLENVNLSRVLEFVPKSIKEEARKISNEEALQFDEDETELVLEINSEYYFEDNTFFCTKEISVSALELAYFLKKKVKNVTVEYVVIRPDILNYISSTKVKYRPIVDKYKLPLPIINSWEKVETEIM